MMRRRGMYRTGCTYRGIAGGVPPRVYHRAIPPRIYTREAITQGITLFSGGLTQGITLFSGGLTQEKRLFWEG